MTTINTTLPSIRNRALLVSINFTSPQKTKTDRKATQDAEAANSAHGAGRYIKNLYPEHLLKPITLCELAAREYLRSMTTPFGSTGLYLLATDKFMDVANRLSQYQLERQQLVTVFAQNYSNVLAQAQQTQGNLFDPSVYPDVSTVVNQFTMNINYLPVGDLGGGLFDTVEKELADAITAEVETTTKRAINDAVSAPLERLMDVVLNIHDKTSRDGARLHETVVEELDQVTALMPSLNVLGLPALNALAERCAEQLSAHVEVLRDKESMTRGKVAEASGTIIREAGIDPSNAKGATQAERKEMAKTAAANILAGMKGFF